MDYIVFRSTTYVEEIIFHSRKIDLILILRNCSKMCIRDNLKFKTIEQSILK